MTGGERYGHLAPIAPALSGNGLAMRVGLFTEALARHGSTDVAALGEGPGDTWAPEGVRIHALPQGGDGDPRLRLVARLPVGKGARALRALGRPVASAALSGPVLAAISRLGAEHCWRGLVLSRAYMAPALAAVPPPAAGGPVLLDLDDDDAALLRERAALARACGDDDDAAWLEAEADAFDMAIAAAAPRVALFTAASDAVGRSVGARLAAGRIVTVPNAMPPTPDAPASGPRDGLVFVGNLSYEPNIDGLLWFLRAVFPRLRAAGAVRLRVCGSRPPPAVIRACDAPGVELHADPADLTELYALSAAAVVPLRLGSGTRIKILEAAAHGLPVVATARAAEGLDPSIVAETAAPGDDPEGFAGGCLRLLNNPEIARRRAARLQALVASRHERSAVVGALADLIGDVFEPSRSRGDGTGGRA